jgi:malonyl-CoA O-methyltransferase
MARGEQALRSHYPDISLLTQATPGATPLEQPSWWRSLTRPFKPRGSQPFDAQQSPPVGLVWANMMLHWADADLPALLATWHRSLATEGFLMFSAFGPDTLRSLNAVHEAMGWGPAGPAFIDMHDLGDQLVHSGFADPVMDMEMITLSWPDLPALLRELRGLGGNTAAQRFAGLRTPRWQQRWHAALEQALRGPDGRLSLRFEILYGHAFKPQPRPAMQAETTVSLDEMRSLVRRGPTGNAR